MKKILITIVMICFVINANGQDEIEIDKDNFNLICINPLISEKSTKTKVYKSIRKGYGKQVKSLYNKVSRFGQIKIKHYMYKNYKIKGDKESNKEFLAMLEAVNDYFQRVDANKNDKKKSTGLEEFSTEDEFDFSETEISELTKKGDTQEDKYKTLFINAMDDIVINYSTVKNEDNLWIIPFNGQKDHIAPNVVFGEYFNPSKRGRRYFLNINIFFFIIDSDGDVRVMSKEISDFNWKRNFRFISSQSGKVIQDTITKFTGVDIK
jgi:hypothetical protein